MRTRPILLVLAAGASLLLGPGCDNPACVFGPGGCSGGGAGLGENPATLPRNGEWIETISPSIIDVLPDTSEAAAVTTPIVLVFNETIVPTNFGTDPVSGLGTAFELQSALGQTIPLTITALVGDGRVLVLFLPTDLPAETSFDIVMKEDAKLADLTGQTVTRPLNGLVGSFTTLAQPSALPRVLAAWPSDGSVNQSATPEIVVVFDRRMNAATVDADSFEVLVDGTPPAFDAAPSAFQFLFNGVPQGPPETRLFRWKSFQGSGVAAPLGDGVTVEVELSPAGHLIEDEEGAVLPATTFDFETAPFSAPLSAAIVSEPTDAIGIDQISGPANLAVQVMLQGAVAGDRLILTMFGASPADPLDPQLAALRREIEIVAPFDSFTMTAAEIDLLASSSPVAGRLADGPIAMAFQLKHGNATSPVRLLDVEPDLLGVQHPTLDTVRPTILGLSTSGAALDTLRSDQRDLVLVGRASESISRALVVTSTLGDNEVVLGEAPPVVGSDPSGLFVAAPVPAGVLAPADLPVDFEITVFDSALNSATAVSDVTDPADGFRQLGQSGPGPALPGGTIAVEVFDATTLAPIVDADVHVAENLGGVVSLVPGSPVPTNAAGFASVPAAPAGETILTVEKAGYDVFTFDGVPTGRLGVPLTPTSLAAANASGTLGPPDLASVLELNAFTRAVADSRRVETAPYFATVATCTADAQDDRFECPFGPVPVRPRTIGAQSAITVLEPSDIFLYSALAFLKTAEIAVPALPVAPGATLNTHLPLGELLDSGTLDPEERPVDAPPQVVSTAAWPTLAADPVVAVEGTAPGIPGAVGVGRGIVFDTGLPPDTWALRAAYPGSVDGFQDVPSDELGRLVTGGTIGADLLLRVEVSDAAGNRGGARPRFSMLSGALTMPAAPVLPPNPATPNPGGMSFDLAFQDVLPDALAPAGTGIYRVELTDSAGRRWTIFRADPSDAQGPNVVVHVPDLAGIFPLAAGPVDARISGWSWPTFDVAEFLWSDIDREHDLFVHSVLQAFTPP